MPGLAPAETGTAVRRESSAAGVAIYNRATVPVAIPLRWFAVLTA
jgi:hypothetical protein